MGQFNFEETNLICCYRRKTRADTVAAMTAALPYMETEIRELAERTAEKLKKLTEDEFAGLVFLPAEDMEPENAGEWQLIQCHSPVSYPANALRKPYNAFLPV